jgi:hypothetical protein
MFLKNRVKVFFFEPNAWKQACFDLLEPITLGLPQIKDFGRIAYSIINWYRCCKDFYVIQFLINIIRESCFLTICRKHNKSKTWVYGVYTADLNIIGHLFMNRSFFPTRNRLFFMKRKFFPLKSQLFFDDRFFLNL